MNAIATEDEDEENSEEEEAPSPSGGVEELEDAEEDAEEAEQEADEESDGDDEIGVVGVVVVGLLLAFLTGLLGGADDSGTVNRRGPP